MLFADVISELHVECSAWFLQAIVVIQFLVSDVRAFQYDAVSAIFHAVTQRYIVTQLLWYDLLGCLGSQSGEGEIVAMDILYIIIEGEGVSLPPEIKEIVVSVSIHEEIWNVWQALSEGDVLSDAIAHVGIL